MNWLATKAAIRAAARIESGGRLPVTECPAVPRVQVRHDRNVNVVHIDPCARQSVCDLPDDFLYFMFLFIMW